MSKKIILYFLLFNFTNTVLFYNNERKDEIIGGSFSAENFGEINSMAEYVVENWMGIEDQTPEDEDDDWSDPFKIEKNTFCSNFNLSFENTKTFLVLGNERAIPYYTPSFHIVFIDIISPPPRG